MISSVQIRRGSFTENPFGILSLFESHVINTIFYLRIKV